MRPSSIKHPVSIIGLIGLILSGSHAFGGQRHFTYLYEAPTSPPGSFELENSITWTRTVDRNERSDNFAFREELEIGLTDRLQLGIYPLDWSYQDENGASDDGGAIEFIYNFTNPVVDPVGVSLYQEFSAGRRHFESESKLIAQKNFGPLILDYNLTLEAEWEEEGLSEQQGELQQAIGASYEFSQRFAVGMEMLHEIVFPDWESSSAVNNVFIGPNVSYRRHEWFVTATLLAQPTNPKAEPDIQLRTIFGFSF